MNLKTRFKNKAFVLAFVSAVVLMLQQLGLNIVPENWEAILNSLLTILTMMGIVVDPTTPGITDSNEGW